MITSLRTSLSALAVALLLAGGGCTRSNETGGERDIRIGYRMRAVSQREGNCTDDRKGCAEVILEFPEIHTAGTTAAAESINAAVMRFILSPVSGNSEADSVNDVLARFIQAYRDEQEIFPRATSWTLQRRVAILRDTAGIAGVRMNHFEFTGGAHPGERTFYINFDTRTGRRLTLNEIVMPDRMRDLNAAAEIRFRSVRGIGPREDLAGKGFQFPGDGFSVNDNFLIDRDSLVFLFNSYEIAPYALGPTRIALARSSLTGILRQ